MFFDNGTISLFLTFRSGFMTETRKNKAGRGATGSATLLAPIAMTLLLTGCQTVGQSPDDTPAEQGNLTKSEKSLSKSDNNTKVKSTEAKASGAIKSAPKIIQPAPVTDLWVRIEQGLGMNLDVNNRRIDQELNWYKNNRSYFTRISQRAQPYLYFIVKEAEAMEVPLELALMPVVESAYDPFAYSPAGASGLWQFMPATGRQFGLEQDWWYDGRRDAVASTRAALTYMKNLHRNFGSWELALAAYNSGSGRVRNAINKNRRAGKPTTFWDLDLPAETTAYVPKLIALGKIVRNPKKHGITLPPVPNKPYFAKVKIGGQLDLAKAAKLADVPLDQLYRLNPALNRWSTPPEGPHHLVVPVNKAENFRTKLAALPPEERLQWQRYTVKSGDSLIKIAREFRTRAALIQEVNKLTSSNIRVGQALLIPVAAKAANAYNLSANQRLLTRQNSGAPNRHKTDYTVKSGDSFWTIARNHGVGVNELARWNNMAPRDTLRIGQTLAIWREVETANKDAIIRRVTYTVRSGDNLSTIASRFNVRVSQIRDWNNDMSGKYIQPGQLVTLYVDVTKTQIN